jgi:hypothetical protein
MPEIAGVVVANEVRADQSQHVRLIDATELTIPIRTLRPLAGSLSTAAHSHDRAICC